MIFRVDFIGIGAAKCGTTWVADVLRKHSSVFIPEKKEINYFNKYSTRKGWNNIHYKKPLEWYANHFSTATKNQITGEITPAYIWNKNCPKDIYKHNPNVKILAFLRNPVDRTYSEYLYGIQTGGYPNKSFEDILYLDKELIKKGLYFQDLLRYMQVFPHKNIKIILYDDIMKNPKKVITEIEKFLTVDIFIPNVVHIKSNETKVFKYPLLSDIHVGCKNFLKKCGFIQILHFSENIGLKEKIVSWRVKNSVPLKVKSINSKTKQKLLKYFKKDIEQLEHILNRDLSTWKK